MVDPNEGSDASLISESEARVLGLAESTRRVAAAVVARCAQTVGHAVELMAKPARQDFVFAAICDLASIGASHALWRGFRAGSQAQPDELDIERPFRVEGPAKVNEELEAAYATKVARLDKAKAEAAGCVDDITNAQKALRAAERKLERAREAVALAESERDDVVARQRVMFSWTLLRTLVNHVAGVFAMSPGWAVLEAVASHAKKSELRALLDGLVHDRHFISELGEALYAFVTDYVVRYKSAKGVSPLRTRSSGDVRKSLPAEVTDADIERVVGCSVCAGRVHDSASGGVTADMLRPLSNESFEEVEEVDEFDDARLCTVITLGDHDPYARKLSADELAAKLEFDEAYERNGLKAASDDRRALIVEDADGRVIFSRGLEKFGGRNG